MARLTWNAAGERFFEAGVDRGVLYVEGVDGVPWNGLIAVSESPSGGKVVSHYIDGVKYLNQVEAEEFEANIEAYTYPDEFAQCEGATSIKNGLFATQQSKKSFGLAYRTRVGNDLNGVDHAYKIHLVYGATVSPTERQNTTIGEDLEPFNFTWHLVTKPPVVTSGHKPTAHFVIDSQETPDGLLDEIEDILYGSANEAPRLPSVLELLFRFNEYEATIFDAGHINDPYFDEFDAGSTPNEPQTSLLDGGGP